MSIGNPYILHNAPLAPADGTALVQALLAFVNGRDVVIRDQSDRFVDEPLEFTDVTRWSKSQESVDAPGREVFARVLDGIINRIDQSEALVTWRNDPFVDGRHYAVASGLVRWEAKKPRLEIMSPGPGGAVVENLFDRQAVTSDSWLSGFLPYLRELSGSIKRESFITVKDDSYAFVEYRRFVTVSAALTCGLFAVLDESGEFRAKLSRCKLPRCGRYYLASKNERGGPANRTYCSPKHRDEYRDSAERKREARRPK
jgi:hypothetical protein